MNELGSDKFYIELYEIFKCVSKEELKKHEGKIIREIATMNMRIAGRTIKEWYNDNKDTKVKEYNTNNKIK